MRVRVRVPVCGWRSTCVRETFRSKGFILVLLKHLQGVERFTGKVSGEDAFHWCTERRLELQVIFGLLGAVPTVEISSLLLLFFFFFFFFSHDHRIITK